MRYLLVGGPLDGQTEEASGTYFYGRTPAAPLTFSADVLTVDDERGVATYRRRGRGEHVAYCHVGERQDSIHWLAEGLPDDAEDVRRVDGVPYCWSYRTHLPGRGQFIVHVLGDAIDDGQAATHRMQVRQYEAIALDVDVAELGKEIAAELVFPLEYLRLPPCFVDGCTEKAQGGEIDGLWKPRADWRAPWELLGPVRSCPLHWHDILRMPPTFGDPWGGLAEEQVPAWLRPYLRDNALNAFDRALDHLCTPGRELTVRLRYRHAFTGAWVTAEDYFGLRPPLPTGGKNG